MLNDLGHLWFLWQLLLLCGLFLLLARLGLRFRSPLWWLLLPASVIPMALMPQDFLIFGPETDTAVAVAWRVPAFYAAFFLFGAFFYQRNMQVQRWWMIAILPAVTLLYTRRPCRCSSSTRVSWKPRNCRASCWKSPSPG